MKNIKSVDDNGIKRFIVQGQEPDTQDLLDEIESLKTRIAELEEENRRLKKQRRERTNKIVRLAVLERDGFKCVRCGKTENLQVHHKKHKEHGGQDVLSNLITLCDSCHAGSHEGEPVHKLMDKYTR